MGEIVSYLGTLTFFSQMRNWQSSWMVVFGTGVRAVGLFRKPTADSGKQKCRGTASVIGKSAASSTAQAGLFSESGSTIWPKTLRRQSPVSGKC